MPCAILLLTIILSLTGCSDAAGIADTSEPIGTVATTASEGAGEEAVADEEVGAAERSDYDGVLDRVFAMFGDDTPGCAVGVVQDGDPAVARGFGMADLETGRPITADTVFDIASVSKQMTAGAIMVLVVEGQIDLDDDIVDWLPALDVEPATVTIGDLVHHTSGLPDYTGLLDADITEVTTAQDALDTLAGVDADDPGATFEYNNTNYFLLGQIVEAATGETLVDYAASEVFAPLGMTRTTYRDDQGTFTPDQAVGYNENEDGTFTPAVSAWQQTGDGAVHTTITDLMIWAGLFLGEPRDEGVGSPEWLDLMLEPGPIPDEDGSTYAGGIGLYDVDGSPVLAHSGSWIGVSSYLQVQPEDGSAIGLACNIDGLDTESLVDNIPDLGSRRRTGA